VTTILHFIKHLVMVHHVNVRCLLKKVHLHLHRFVEQLFKFRLSLRIVVNINFKQFTIGSRISNSGFLEPNAVFIAKLVDLMSVEFGHQFVHKFLLNWEVIFNVVMQHFDIFQHFWVQTNFLEQFLSDLVVLYHAHHAHFLDSFHENFLA